MRQALARLFGLEVRQASYTDALVQAIQANAAGQITTLPSSTSALEGAAGLVGRAFAGATVDTPELLSVLTPAFMEMVGRALIRRGELVCYINVSNGTVDLVPVAAFDIEDEPHPATWTYRLTVGGPSRTHTISGVPSEGVIHFTYARDPEQPWLGMGPLQVASLGGRLSAETVAALADESAGPRGNLLPIPADGSGQQGLATQLSGLKGKVALVEAGDWNNPGGRNDADWNARRLGANPPASLVELQRLATEEIYMACGVPPGLFSARNNAGSREAYRQFIHATIAPLGRLVADELQRKLEVPVSITWEELRSADIAGRARAFQSLVGAGMELDRASALAGLLMPD